MGVSLSAPPSSTIPGPRNLSQQFSSWLITRSQAMSGKACTSYMPRMIRIIDEWVHKVASFGGNPMSINQWVHFLTLDITGDIAWGKSFDQLASGHIHPAVGAVHGTLKYSVTALQLAWFFDVMLKIPGIMNPLKDLDDLCRSRIKERELEDPEEKDILSYIDLQAHFNKNPTALADNVRVLTMAASGTSYSTLVCIFFYLARDPELQSRLRKEVLPAFDNNPAAAPSWAILSPLPLLHSIINETMRVHPPTPQGLPRDVPEGPGMKLGPYWVPGGVHVSSPIWTLHHDSRHFETSDDWIPERWTTQSHLIKDRRAYMPFSIGPMNCAEKFFAIQEMILFVSKVVTNFEIWFVKGEDGTQLLTDWKDHFTTW
jgi:cytochrome P450 family 628